MPHSTPHLPGFAPRPEGEEEQRFSAEPPPKVYAMHYKTIVLELLQDQYPALHEQLGSAGRCWPSLDAYAIRAQDEPRALESIV